MARLLCYIIICYCVYCLYAQGPWCGATGGGSFEFRVGFQQRENFGLGLPQWEVQCHYASQHLCINLVYPPQELILTSKFISSEANP